MSVPGGAAWGQCLGTGRAAPVRTTARGHTACVSIAGSHPEQNKRHHPPVGGALRRQALMVLETASNEPGWSPAATVHPQTSSTGATADETTPHHGTPRTTTTVAGATASLIVPSSPASTMRLGRPVTRPQ